MPTDIALGVTSGDCVAVVGAGGKTTLCWVLVQHLAQTGRVVFTTTTHIRRPAPGVFDVVRVGGEVSGTFEVPLTSPLPWRTACVASGIVGVADDTPLPESGMPVVHTRLKGLTGQQVCDLRSAFANPQSPISSRQSPVSFVIEADGARGLWLKAPAEHEPAIPSCATAVCVVANLQVLGRPLDGRVAHRPKRIAALAGIAEGQPITPRVLVDTLTHPQGGLKGIPAQTRKVAVLMHPAGLPPPPEAESITRELMALGYDLAVTLERAG